MSDINGMSSRAILDALIKGEEDPTVLADLSVGKLRCKKQELARALKGLISEHQRKMLSIQLRHIDFIEEELKCLNEEIVF